MVLAIAGVRGGRSVGFGGLGVARGFAESMLVTFGVGLVVGGGSVMLGGVFGVVMLGGLARCLAGDDIGRRVLGHRRGGLDGFGGGGFADGGFVRWDGAGILYQMLVGNRFAALHVLALAMAAMAVPAAAAAAAMIGFGVGLALLARFFRQQRLPVGDGNLIIVGVDFREGQEAVSVAAVIDERRLQGRLDPRDFGEIDVTAKLPAVGALEVEFLDAVATQHHDPGFFGVGRVDQHFVGHG